MRHSRETQAWLTDVGTTGHRSTAFPTTDDSIAAAIWELGMTMRMMVATPYVGLPLAIAHGRKRLQCFEAAEEAKGDSQSVVLIDAYTILLEALDELSRYVNSSAVEGARHERLRIIEILANLADAADGDAHPPSFIGVPHQTAAVPTAPPRPQAVAANPLTQREQEVLDLLATGADNREIASALTISQKTAKKHVCNVMEKLGVSDRLKAVVKGIELGLVAAGSRG